MTLPLMPMSAERRKCRDQFLQRAVRDFFHHDERVRGLDLTVEFDGGVAHMAGLVERAEQLNLARQLVGQFDGVVAVWDQVRVGGSRPAILDLGCGDTKQYRHNIGVDIRPAEGVDVVADLAEPLPFPDDSVDRIFAVHVLEHLLDFLPLVDECHRVLRPDGVLHAVSPWWRYVNAVADPTHVRLLDVQTFKGICSRPGSSHRWYPLHAGCDGATIFADLRPLDDAAPPPPPDHLARFFD